MDQELIILGPSSSGALAPEEEVYTSTQTYTTALTHPEDHNLTPPDPPDEDPALEGPSLLDCDWGLIRAPGNGSGDPFKLGSGAVGSGPFARIRSYLTNLVFLHFLGLPPSAYNYPPYTVRMCISYLCLRWIYALVICCAIHAFVAGYLLSGIVNPTAVIQANVLQARVDHPTTTNTPSIRRLDAHGSLTASISPHRTATYSRYFLSPCQWISDHQLNHCQFAPSILPVDFDADTEWRTRSPGMEP